MDLPNMLNRDYIRQIGKLNRQLFIFQAQVFKSGGKSGSCNLDKIAKFQLLIISKIMSARVFKKTDLSLEK